MNHHNKRDTQSLKSKIAEIRHYNNELFLSIHNLFNIDIRDIYITLTPNTITIHHAGEYSKHELKNILKISNTQFTKAVIVLCNKITITSNIHSVCANWQEMARQNEYTPELTELKQVTHKLPRECKTNITLENLTFHITDKFIIDLKRFFISYDQNNRHNIFITYDIPEYNKSDIIKSHIDPIQFEKAYYKFHYSIYADSTQSYVKCHQTGKTTTIREKQTKHYRSYFLNKQDNTTDNKTHLYDIKISLLNDILLEEENEIYGPWETRKGVYFYKNGISLNTTPLLCSLNDYKGDLQGRGARVSINLIADLDKEFGIKSVKQIYQETYNNLQAGFKQPIAFACYTAHMKYEYITKNTKQITLTDVEEITNITREILETTQCDSSTLSKLRHSNVYNKIDGETPVKLDLDYTKEDKKPDRQKKVFQQLNMLKYANLPSDVLDTFEEIIGLYGL